MAVTVVPDGAEILVGMPDGWYEMPDPDSAAAQLWPVECVGRFGFEGPDSTLAFRALTDAMRTARSQQRPKRLRWIFLGEPALPLPQAWASLDLVPRAEADAVAAADAYEHGARTASVPQGPVTAWHREISRVELDGQPAVVIHDLLTLPGPEPDEAPGVQHRAVVALFPEQQVLASLAVSTPWIAALPDLEAAALAIAGSIRIAVPA